MNSKNKERLRAGRIPKVAAYRAPLNGAMGERFAALTPTNKSVILAKLADLEAEQRAERRKAR